MERKARQLTSTFVQSLENDPGMDLNTKLRVRDYVKRLLYDMQEENIDICSIYL